MILGKTIDQLEVGQAAEVSKTMGESDVNLYAGLTGDFNPAHVDEVWASQTAFKGRIAHGMLSAGLISALLGFHLPGPGTVWASQELHFLAPVRIGDTITGRVEVTAIDRAKKRVTLRTTCANQDGVLVIDGQAVVSPPRPPKA